MKQKLDVAAALIKKGDQILLCQRKEDDNYALLWEFPGGVVEVGEKPSSAIEREIKEELNLTIKAKGLISEFFDEDDNLKIRIFLFECEIKGGNLQAKDCRDFGFFSLNQAKALCLAPADVKIFDYLFKKNKI